MANLSYRFEGWFIRVALDTAIERSFGKLVYLIVIPLAVACQKAVLDVKLPSLVERGGFRMSFCELLGTSNQNLVGKLGVIPRF